MKKLRDSISRKLKRFINNQAGFTLIELVMVIVILGILAATAVPKFLDLSGSAINSTGKSTAGAMASAAAIEFARNAVRNPAAPQYPGCINVDAEERNSITNATEVSGIEFTACTPNTAVAALYTIVGTISGSAGCTWEYNSSTTQDQVGTATVVTIAPGGVVFAIDSCGTTSGT